MIPFFTPQAKMIEGNNTIRAAKCTQEIQEVLRRYDCEMEPFVEITSAKTTGGVRIIAKTREKEKN